MIIDMSYGSGGKETSSLINNIFLKHFDNKILNKLEDAATLRTSGKIAFTTDCFVVTPLFFGGGDIGRLAICGTVNYLLTAGSIPRYISVGFIIEEGADTSTIEKIAISMRAAADEAKVKIVAGDTKVIEGNGGVYINTSGIGDIIGEGVSITGCKEGDSVILTGTLGDHHACILSSRMEIENNIKSDAAPLGSITNALYKENIKIHAMRDVTRGGLATILNEMATASKVKIELKEVALPVNNEVKAFCGILGLDPLYMGNEGKMVIIVPKSQSEKALAIIRKTKYGKQAEIIGAVTKGNGVTLTTALGGIRTIDILYGEGLPRIC
jgi:hydrogenase expression/formation protein HypE